MIQLRSFVQQRLFAAAEEILAEVEKTVFAFYEAEVHRLKEEPQNQLQKPDSLRQISATESPLTKEEVLQETPTQPSIQDESNVSRTEVPGPPQTSADTDNNDADHSLGQTNFKMSQIKEEEEEEEEEETGADSQTGETIFPSLEGVESELETQVSYELQPVSSDCSAAESGSNGSDEERVQSKVARTKMRRRKVKILQSQNGSVKHEGPAALPDGDSTAKSQKERSVCPTCGKDFQYVRSFMKHIKTHKRTSESTAELLRRLQSAQNKRLSCDVCGKTFSNLGCLQLHSKIHTGIKDFKCQACGKTFVQKQHLTVHTKIHSGERPYHCAVCGKTFIQRQNLIVHRRTHTGERPYCCGSCGKLFYTVGHLKSHTKSFSGQKPPSCDICGKTFCRKGQLIQHKNAHTAESVVK